MTCDLNDQHALVTGAGQGIGEAIARQLLASGARVTVLGRRAHPLQKLVDEHPGRCQMVLADVANESEVKAAFAKAVSAQGAINILVNNAGKVGFEFEAKAPKAEKPAAKAAKADEGVAASDAPVKKATKTVKSAVKTTAKTTSKAASKTATKTTTKVASTRATKKPAVRKTAKTAAEQVD